MTDEEKVELMNRRQRQILVHSCLYYQMNINFIDDHLFDFWSKELVRFMAVEPELAKQTPYYNEFLGFDGSTGHDLPFWLDEIQRAAERLASTPNKQEAFK